MYCEDCEESYAVLDLADGSPRTEIKSAYRDLVKIWHPDRFGSDERVRLRAEEQLKRINEAHAHLMLHCPAANAPEIPDEPVTSVASKEAADPPYSTSEAGSDDAEEIPVVDKVDSRAWRYIKVCLRSVWGIFKILMVALAALIVAAIILLGLLLLLHEYWTTESRRERGYRISGSHIGRLFTFMSAVTWLPRQILGGLVFVISILFLCLISAGNSLWSTAIQNATLSLIATSLLGMALMAWVLRKEWKAEFEADSVDREANANSWVMGLIVLTVGIAAGIWQYSQSAPSMDHLGNSQPVQAHNQPTEAVIEPQPAIQLPGDKYLLWDYTSEQEKPPGIPEDMKDHLKSLIGPIQWGSSSSDEDMAFGPALRGAFYEGQPPDSQTAYSVTIPWVFIQGRSHVQGDMSFLFIATGDHIDTYDISQYADSILKVFRTSGAPADFILMEGNWQGQEQQNKYLRVLSVANHSLKLVMDAGISSYATFCEGWQPIETVEDRVYYSVSDGGTITLLPREHFSGPCPDGQPYTSLGVDNRHADQVAYDSIQNKPTEAQNQPTPASTPTESLGEDEADKIDAEISNALDNWAKANESNDPSLIASCYAEHVDRYFLRQNVTNAFVHDYLATWFKENNRRVNTFVVKDGTFETETASNAQLRVVKDVVTTDSQNTTERFTRSELSLVKIGGEWKITSERDFK